MHDDMQSRVRTLVRESFVDGAEKADREGVMPTEHYRALHEVGFSRALLPSSVGGGGLSCEEIVRCMAEIAYVDPSTAIAFNMHVCLASYIATLPFEILTPILADLVDNGATVCGSVSLPTGDGDTRKAGFVFRDEGEAYVVDGKLGFASGSDAATYFIMMGSLDGAEEHTIVLSFPKLSDPGITVMENWDAIGLRGTASHDILASGLRIAKTDAIALPVSALEAMMSEMPIDTIRRQHVGLCTIMACWEGLCQATLDHLVEFSRKRFGFTKVPFNKDPDTYRSQDPWVRNRLGHLAYMLETGRVLLEDFARQIDSHEPVTVQEFRAVFARCLTHWKLTVDEFIIGAMRVGGAHGFVAGSRIGWFIRDLMGCAVMTWRTDDMPRVVAQGLFGEPIVLGGLAGT